MSLGYSIDVNINAPFNEENVKSILERGTERHFIYYKFMVYEGKKLNLSDATRLVFDGDPDYDVHCLSTKIENEYINLHFINSGGLITVMISGISHDATKKFKNDIEDIDVAKYAKILLDITQNFQILSINIEKD